MPTLQGHLLKSDITRVVAFLCPTGRRVREKRWRSRAGNALDGTPASVADSLLGVTSIGVEQWKHAAAQLPAVRSVRPLHETELVPPRTT